MVQFSVGGCRITRLTRSTSGHYVRQNAAKGFLLRRRVDDFGFGCRLGYS